MDRDDTCLCLCVLHCISPMSVQGLVPAYIVPSQIQGFSMDMDKLPVFCFHFAFEQDHHDCWQ